MPSISKSVQGPGDDDDDTGAAAARHDCTTTRRTTNKDNTQKENQGGGAQRRGQLSCALDDTMPPHSRHLIYYRTHPPKSSMAGTQGASLGSPCKTKGAKFISRY